MSRVPAGVSAHPACQHLCTSWGLVSCSICTVRDVLDQKGADIPDAAGMWLCPACRTSGPSPGPATCIDFDVLLPVKLQEKIAPAIDPLLEDKQVSQPWPASQGLCRLALGGCVGGSTQH